MSFMGEDHSQDGYGSNDEELYWTLPPLFAGNVKVHSLRTTKSVVSSQPDLNADGTVDAKEKGLQSQRPSFCFRHAAITELELAASALGVTVPSHEQYMKAVEFHDPSPSLLTSEVGVNGNKQALSEIKDNLEKCTSTAVEISDECNSCLLQVCQQTSALVKARKQRSEGNSELVTVCNSLVAHMATVHARLDQQLNSSKQDPTDKDMLKRAIWLVQLTGEVSAAVRPLYQDSDDAQLQQLGSLCVSTLASSFVQMQAFQKWVFSQLLPCRLLRSSIGVGSVLCGCWETAINAVAAMATWPECQKQALEALHICLAHGAGAAATQLASRINREVDQPQASQCHTPSHANHTYSPPHHYGAPPPPPPPNPRYGSALSSPPPGLHSTPFSPPPPPPPPAPVITAEDAMDKEAVQMLWCLLWAGDSVVAAIPELIVLPNEEEAEDAKSAADAGTPLARAGSMKAPSEAGTGNMDPMEPEVARRAFFELCMAWTRRSEWMGAQLSRMLTKRPDSLDGEDNLVAAILQQRNDVLSFIVQWSTTWLCLLNDSKSTQQMDKLKRHAMKLITHSLEIYTMVSFPMPEPAHAPVSPKVGSPRKSEQSLPNGLLPNGIGHAVDKIAHVVGSEGVGACANGPVSPTAAPGDKFWSLHWGGWQLVRPLGKGSSAQVWKARYHHADVALKLFQLDTLDINVQVQTELDTLRHLASHPNVVRFLGACWRTGGNGAQLAVMMEYCNAGTLHNTIDNARQQSRRRNNAKLQHFYTSWVNRLEIAQNVAAAVAFLHAQGTPHKDLTSYNVLLHYSDPWQAKVADLGLARLIAHPDMDLSTLDNIEHGPDAHWPAWIAPELFKSGAQYDCRADVYSFGVILWELIMLRHPWEQEPPPPPPPGMRPNKSPQQALPQPKTKFVPGDHPVFPPNPMVLEESMPKVTEVIELAEHCWQMDPAARPTMHAVVSKLNGILSKVQRICKA